MKITFKPLPYQLDAVKAVVDVFAGQQQLGGHTRYTLDLGNQPKLAKNAQMGFDLSDPDHTNDQKDDNDDISVGFANSPLFDMDEILKNSQTVQINQGLPKSTEYVHDGFDGIKLVR